MSVGLNECLSILSLMSVGLNEWKCLAMVDAQTATDLSIRTQALTDLSIRTQALTDLSLRTQALTDLSIRTQAAILDCFSFSCSGIVQGVVLVTPL